MSMHGLFTIRGCNFRGKIPFAKYSRSVLLHRSDLDTLIAASVVPAANGGKSKDQSKLV